MKTSITLIQQVPLHGTTNFEFFEIVFEINSQQIKLSTCLRRKANDPVGYSASSTLFSQLKHIPFMFPDSFDWGDAKASIDDSKNCRRELSLMFFKACEHHKYLIRHN